MHSARTKTFKSPTFMIKASSQKKHTIVDTVLNMHLPDNIVAQKEIALKQKKGNATTLLVLPLGCQVNGRTAIVHVENLEYRPGKKEVYLNKFINTTIFFFN